MAKCKVCGTRLAEGVAKCPSCGAAAGSTVSGTVSPGTNLQKSLCPSCGAQILGEHKYCPNCGTDLQEAAKQATPSSLCKIKEPALAQCLECGVQVDIAQTQDQTAYQTEMQAQQNLQTDDQFDHNSDKTSAQFQQKDKKNTNIAQRIIYYAAVFISALGGFLYDILTAISFSEPDTKVFIRPPTVAKIITRIIIGIGDFIFLLFGYLGFEVLLEDKFSFSIADDNSLGVILLKVGCLYGLYYLLLFIISVLNLVPTVIYIFCSSKNLSFSKAYGKCIKHFAPVIGLLCSIFGYGTLILG